MSSDWYLDGRTSICFPQMTPIPSIYTISFLIKHILILRFIMLYTEKFGLQDCSGFLQIESHILSARNLTGTYIKNVYRCFNKLYKTWISFYSSSCEEFKCLLPFPYSKVFVITTVCSRVVKVCIYYGIISHSIIFSLPRICILV